RRVEGSVQRRLSRTPDLLALHAADPERYFCLMRSGAYAPRTGRYDILFVEGQCLGACDARQAQAEALLATLDVARATAADKDALPFVGGYVFHLGYEAVGQFEPRLVLPRRPEGLPDIVVWKVDQAIIIDHARDEAWCVAPDEATARALARSAEQSVPPVEPGVCDIRHREEEAPERYLDNVRAVLDYLLGGDCFQVNLSRGWAIELDKAVPPPMLHEAMHRRNPAPFSALLKHGDEHLVSASPERLLRVRDGRVDTRPIAGTRRRGRDVGEDAAMRAELNSSLKERAEHVMLIDLERNDLGRICVPGSVQVEEMLTQEQYASVHHLVSNIAGDLDAGYSYSDVLRAGFPGGTITGCPKFRVMEIIAELEGEGRGSYTGSLGYVSRNGRMDSNILIRTLRVRDRDIRFRAGAGIVADSDPEAELAETRAKAQGMLRALGA
ncbi:MAG: aminodeoxychorismate synthase component I, partial [Algiphilus sp.]